MSVADLTKVLDDAGAEYEAGADLEVEQPWEDYDRMKAAEIQQRLADASDEVAAVVRLYESMHKGRQTVLRAADLRIRTNGS